MLIKSHENNPVGHAVPTGAPVSGSLEWLHARQSGLGGSDIAAVLGLSNWRSRHDVYMSKVEPVAESLERRIPLDVGHYLEPLVLQYLAEDLAQDHPHKAVRTVEHGMRHPAHEWARANVDGVVVDGDGVVEAIVECKTTSRAFDWPDGPPVYYLTQVRWYLAVCGLSVAYVCCLFGNRNFDWWRVEQDDEDAALMLEEAEKFWTQHVVPRVPPPVDGSYGARDMVAALHSGDGDDVVELDRSAEGLLASRAQLTAEIKSLQERQRQLDTELLLRLGNSRRGELDNYRVTRVQRDRIDEERLALEHPDVYRECRRAFDAKVLKRNHPELAKQYTTPGRPYVRVYGD